MDQRILGYLGRALSLEWSAIQTYSTQSRLAVTWGLDGPAARLRDLAQQDFVHSERITTRMISLGAAPGASQLRPAMTGPDLLACLRADLDFEADLLRLYTDGAAHGTRIGSSDDKVFFQTLVEEHEARVQMLARWIGEVGGTGGARQNMGAEL